MDTIHLKHLSRMFLIVFYCCSILPFNLLTYQFLDHSCFPNKFHITSSLGYSGSVEHDNKCGMEDHSAEEVKELKTSKWSNEVDEGDGQRYERSKSNSSALSGLISVYGKKGKSVSWGDKVCF